MLSVSAAGVKNVVQQPGFQGVSLALGYGTKAWTARLFRVPLWSPLPVLRERDRVRACEKPRATSGLRQALTPTLSRSTGRGRKGVLAPRDLRTSRLNPRGKIATISA